MSVFNEWDQVRPLIEADPSVRLGDSIAAANARLMCEWKAKLGRRTELLLEAMGDVTVAGSWDDWHQRWLCAVRDELDTDVPAVPLQGPTREATRVDNCPRCGERIGGDIYIACGWRPVNMLMAECTEPFKCPACSCVVGYRAPRT